MGAGRRRVGRSCKNIPVDGPEGKQQGQTGGQGVGKGCQATIRSLGEPSKGSLSPPRMEIRGREQRRKSHLPLSALHRQGAQDLLRIHTYRSGVRVLYTALYFHPAETLRVVLSLLPALQLRLCPRSFSYPTG